MNTEVAVKASVPQGEGRDGAAPSLDPTRCPECGQMGQWYQHSILYLAPCAPYFICWPCAAQWEDTRG